MADLREISFTDPFDNIHYDQVLLEEAEAGRIGPTLRFWESARTFIVLGRIGRPEEELNVSAVQEDGVPVIRRCSGGGTVVQGPGCLNYTCVLAKEEDPAVADLRRSYQYILSKVTAALKDGGVEAEFLPISDIALCAGLRKISGNAQKRGRRYILHHGTVLYRADLSLIPRYLAMPPSMPDYRKNRDHLEFVTNAEVDIAVFRRSMAQHFDAGSPLVELSEEEKLRLRQLQAEGRSRVSL